MEVLQKLKREMSHSLENPIPDIEPKELESV
jgi:hypothetical protein